jgi:malonate transporter
MTAVLAALIPVFVLIAAGNLARRWVMPDPEQWAGVEILSYYLLFPALLIDTLARADLSRVPIAGVGGALIVSILVMSALCFALLPLLTRAGVNGPDFTSLFQGATRWNTFVALAIANSLYGDTGVQLASVGMVAQIPLLNVINVWVLDRYASRRPPHWRLTLGTLVRNPLIWSCAIGLALNLAHIPFAGLVHDVAEALGRTSIPLGLLVVGASLALSDLFRPDATALIATALKLVVMPALAIGLGIALGLTGTSLAVVACCSAVPSATNAYILARQLGGNAALMAHILAIETLAAAITMPIAVGLVSP